LNEKLRKGIIFGMFVITLFWGYFNLFNKKNPPAISKSQPMQNFTYQNSKSSVTDRLLSKEVIEEYVRKSWGRDPFYFNYRIDKPSINIDTIHPRLSGISYRELSSQAVINGQILKTGDSLQDYRVTGIFKDHVILERGKQMVTLWVSDQNL
jgi:hypothetical protein